MPPLEKLEIYNLGFNQISGNAVQWFHFSSAKIHVFSNKFQGYFLGFYPYLYLFLNVYFAWTLFFFIRQKGPQRSHGTFKITIGIITLLVLVNMGFSIFANIIALRYQLFPMVTLLSFSLLISDFAEEHLQSSKAQNNTAKGNADPQNANQLVRQM